MKPDRLALVDSKMGRRRVLLGEPARTLLDRPSAPASGGWVFPGARAGEPLGKNALYHFRIKARDHAGILADPRLHDLRHSRAFHAVMQGEGLHMTGRLLGHRRGTTSNRCTHLDDATPSAAERIGNPIATAPGQPIELYGELRINA